MASTRNWHRLKLLYCRLYDRVLIEVPFDAVGYLETEMTSMNIHELKDWYLCLPDSDKVIFLALVSGDLTIHGRAIGLDLSGEKQLRSFNGLNELQHQISFHLAGIGMKADRYPDDVFLQILLEKACSFGLSAHLAQSLDSARTRNYWRRQ